MPDAEARSRSRPERQRFRAALLTVTLVAGCAGSPGVEVTEGRGGDDFAAPDSAPDDADRCGASARSCGGGCCGAGERCQLDRCVPDAACGSNDDCDSDSLCGGGACVPWDLIPRATRHDRFCRWPVDLASLEPVVQCQWPGASPPEVEPASVQVLSTPMVVDFDLDDDPTTRKPSIVFVSYAGAPATPRGVLRVIDGETCQLQASVSGAFPFSRAVSPALGDIDADGRPEIVVIDEQPVGAATRSGVVAYGWSGGALQQRWRRRSTGTQLIQGIALHDLDDDGRPEILTEGALFSHGGESLTPLPGGALEPPIVMDVDGDRYTAEIVTSEGIYYWDSLAERLREKPRTAGDLDCAATNRCLWNPASNVAGLFVALADLRSYKTAVNLGQDSVELVVIGRNGEIWLKQIDGQTHHHVAPNTGAGGPPVIADFDGDGRLELASSGREYLTVYDLDCKDDEDYFNAAGCGNGRVAANADAILWRQPSQGARSGVAVFDFDGDGRAEVMSADQCYLRVHDGLTGSVAFSVPRSSTTAWEYPVVADVDGDGHSEVVIPSNDDDTTVRCSDPDPLHRATRFVPSHGVTVWRDPNDRWQGSRPVWNQHTYFVSNVNDDGTIPRTSAVAAYRDGPNTFRQNTLGPTGISLGRLDLTSRGRPRVECIAGRDRARVQAELCNRGLLAVPAGEASLMLVRAEDERTPLCTSHNDSSLEPGECQAFDCEIDATRGAAAFDVRILADPLGELDECSEDNNAATIAAVACRDDIQ